MHVRNCIIEDQTEKKLIRHAWRINILTFLLRVQISIISVYQYRSDKMHQMCMRAYWFL